ncbi:MAG: hypothetical protein IJV56_03025 [Neisseriaceae bacterium]|nr:hypothetical protein [Neisseriaceae bacterium]
MTYLKSLDAQSLGVLGAVLLAAVFMFVPDIALAAPSGSGSGGLGSVGTEVKGIMDTVLNIITIVVTGGAVIALLFFCFQGLTGRKDWSELIGAVGWCIGIGIAAPFTRWIIKLASETSFG